MEMRVLDTCPKHVSVGPSEADGPLRGRLGSVPTGWTQLPCKMQGLFEAVRSPSETAGIGAVLMPSLGL
jgi:hypothetical protein